MRRGLILLPLLLSAACGPDEAKAPPAPPSGQLEGPWRPSDWVYIPAGGFTLGAQSTDPSAPGYDLFAQPNEGPPRHVTHGAYFIQLFEVTAMDYENCLGHDACQESDIRRGGGYFNIGNPKRGTHPANGVSWAGARRYCEWMKARLPSEVEWERAARGDEGRRWPAKLSGSCLWDGRRLQGLPRPEGVVGLLRRWRGLFEEMRKGCNVDGTIAVGNYDIEAGRSASGALGMSGNVWEWVEDRYEAGQDARVQRGGGWSSADPTELRAAARASMAPSARFNDVGFRCVRDAPR